MVRVAVIGSGISGLAAAWRLSDPSARCDVTLLEADCHFGGHAHTVDLTLEGHTHGVDTGFLVYNHRTYPLLTQLLTALEVESAPSEMSFSVQVPQAGGGRGLEWSGNSLDTVFAQRSNLLRPRFWRMLGEILRFNRLATAWARSAATSPHPQTDPSSAPPQTIAEFLDAHHFGPSFRQDYLLPMIGCIWSCPTDQMLRFPVETLIRFCHNHGLIQITDRPQWYTVRGGSREYVRRMVSQIKDARLNSPVLGLTRLREGVLIRTHQGTEWFDAVVIACHSDQALRMLGAHASPAEQQVLGAIRYQPNMAVLHTDASVLPIRRKAWAAWNYERAAQPSQEHTQVCLHYLINRLQPLPWQQPVIVSLNPARAINPHHIHQQFEYAHPVFDGPALQAQARVTELQGHQRTWYCGAWCGYGFHEDGLRSGLNAAEALLQSFALSPEASPPPPTTPALARLQKAVQHSALTA